MTSRAYSLVLTVFMSEFCCACAADDSGSSEGTSPASQSDLAAPGPYEVSTREFAFVDPSRATPANGTYSGAPDRTLPTKVWYPSSAAAIASGERFPVIAYAHGFLSSKDEAGELKTHLASHGYVIIAPDFPLSNAQAPGGPTIVDLANQPGDLAFVVEQVSAQTGENADVADILDTTRLGVAGLSLGGGTTLISVYHPVLQLPDVQAAVAFAPLSCAFGKAMYVRALPTLIVSGGSDLLVPFDTISTRPQEWAPAPLEVANLVGGTHTGFLGIDNPDANNTDELGCSAVQNATGGATFDPSTLEPLIAQLNAGTDGNIADVAGCGAVCATQYTQTMRGPRQLELTKAATLAHFEAVLRGKADTAAYLTTSFDAQNDDVEVTRLR